MKNDLRSGYQGPANIGPDFPSNAVVYTTFISQNVSSGAQIVRLMRDGTAFSFIVCDDLKEAEWMAERLSGTRTKSTSSEQD